MAIILVIDDDQLLRETMRRHLAKAGHTAAAAEDGAKGLAAFRKDKPDVVLLDIQLPDTDGIKVMEVIKAEAPATEVVLITGHADVKTSLAALRKGAFDYLLKPFEREELEICVSRALRQRDMQRRLDEHVKDLEKANRDLKETQTHLIQSEKMAALGQLAAGMAHEVNNPLTAVCMNTAFLLQDIKDEKQVRRLKTIEKEADRATAIVRTLLQFSRKSKGDKKTAADVNAAISEIVMPVERQLALRNITVSLEAACALPRAALDVNRMQQVFLNLLNNARDAMAAGGKLTIRTTTGTLPSAAGGLLTAVVIEFDDTGPGFPPENIGKLFVPFFTTKDPGKGVGLGLYIVRAIVADHGGDIEAENIPGGGARFRIRLPAVPDAAAAEKI